MLHVTCLGKLPSGMTKAKVASLAVATCKRVARHGSLSLSVRVVDDKTIRNLNRTHRRKDKVTDVLSFSVIDALPKAVRAQGRGELGDIIIALPQVRRQAKVIGRSTKAEFSLMVVHGTLHLLGYDHETLAQERKMFGLQHDVLIKEGIF